MANKKYFSVWVDTLANGSQQYYYVKDTDARTAIQTIQERLSRATNIVGFTSTPLTDGATTTTLTPVFSGSLLKTTGFVTGDLVYYRPATNQPTREFICLNVKTSETAEASLIWCEFGSTGSLGSLAFKDSVTLEYTPKGRVSLNLTPTKAGFVSKLTSGSVTEGTNPSIADGFLQPGKPTAVTPGNLPTLTCEYNANDESLSLSFNPGTKTSVTPGVAPSLDTTKFNPGSATKVTLPVPTMGQAVTDIAGTATFTGTEESVTAN